MEQIKGYLDIRLRNHYYNRLQSYTSLMYDEFITNRSLLFIHVSITNKIIGDINKKKL